MLLESSRDIHRHGMLINNGACLRVKLHVCMYVYIILGHVKHDG